ncbi:His Kinase A (phospho-acceptor) domain-containing protein [Chitinophaga sp. CF118]|uniref:sensor histidine kinase n=1 Tax=Chitinophaga sp. CF118 TaxID=1884367 RepID=UPI0008EDAF03|nr:HAMP domain-containing sensor histidine kinase [Chitinophaga sp. CF118]SFE03362.1 His Kinase A (phospho-acceptor) domain-containing protein [Chitinophaga sp. CF118]
MSDLNNNTSNIIAIVSHEFKTPLTAISSAVDLIAAKLHIDNYMDPFYKKNMSKITTEIFKLNNMLDEILTMSNIISNSIEIKKELTDVQEVLNDLKAHYFTDRKDARTFKIKVSGTHNKIYVDKKQLSTIFSNLINNALKFSNKKMPAVELKYEEQALIIAIEDDGIGIPPQDLPYLFQPFYRGSNVNNIEGTGLGLHIVKNFVTANNGTITVQSEQNKGTIFILKFAYTGL